MAYTLIKFQKALNLTIGNLKANVCLEKTKAANTHFTKHSKHCLGLLRVESKIR